MLFRAAPSRGGIFGAVSLALSLLAALGLGFAALRVGPSPTAVLLALPAVALLPLALSIRSARWPSSILAARRSGTSHKSGLAVA